MSSFSVLKMFNLLDQLLGDCCRIGLSSFYRATALNIVQSSEIRVSWSLVGYLSSSSSCPKRTKEPLQGHAATLRKFEKVKPV